MDVILRCAAVALLCCLMCLLLRRTQPELSMLLSAAGIVLLLSAGVTMAQGLKELGELVGSMVEDSQIFIGSVMKCVAIGIVTKIASELCRDQAQASVAAAVDLAGTLCALGASMPLFISMLKLIGGLV